MKPIALLTASLIQLALIPSAYAQARIEPTAAEPQRSVETIRRDKSSETEKESSSAHRHDGFYLRFGMGVGAYGESFQSRSTERYGGKSGGTARGFASVGEFALGTSVAPGLVLGGGLYTASVLSESYDPDQGVTVPDELAPGRRDFAIVGPFADWYPDPTRGFHLQAALGFASLTDGWRYERQSNVKPDYMAFGGGLMLGVGYEWFVADEWSLGVLARVTGAVVTGEDDNGVRFFHALGTSPSLMLSATYN